MHSHAVTEGSSGDEKRTLYVVILTLVMMIIEIASGIYTGSMALLADGWHMGTHAFALGISYAAFVLARKHASSGIFSFGTGKFGVLAGYTSSLILGAAAAWMIYESILRFLNPVQIAFGEAIGVAVLGLIVNAASMGILGHHDHGHSHGHEHDHDEHEHNHDGHEHEHEHHHDEHEHEHEHEHDHNYKAAYIHVFADALTSVFAIVALLAGLYLGWTFLDPVMGVVGGLVITRWAWILFKETAFILLDKNADEELRKEISDIVEADGDSRVADLHVWHVGSRKVSAIITVISGHNLQAEEYKARLAEVHELVHASVEVYQCKDPDCACRKSVAST